jgi:2-polyprenyl-3-methyl-5-hydroxy-6-metoxy-1,4-benzoquinol methylase
MISLTTRSNETEIMDNLECEGKVVDQTLRELEFINRWLGGNKITLSGISELLKRTNQREVTVADVGCGGGDMLKLIAAWSKKNQINSSLIGIDANPSIIQFARSNCKGVANLSFETQNVLSPEFEKKRYDIIVATLFTHHFTNAELVAMLAHWASQARLGIVVNDLHRHPFAYHSIKWLTQLFSKSSMVKYDAPLSVRRGFLRQELEDILRQANIVNYTLKWRWAFRWQLVISPTRGN